MKSLGLKNFRKVLLTFSLAAIALTAGCGDDTLTGDVAITSTPETPLVKSTDLKLDTDGDGTKETFSGPWFLFNIRYANDSEEKLTISEIGIKGLGQKSGKLVDSDVSIIELDTDSDGIIGFVNSKSFVNFNVYVHGLPKFFSSGTETSDIDSPYIKLEVTTSGYFGDSDQDVKQFFNKIHIFGAQFPN